jgi:predicted amidohydrolase
MSTAKQLRVALAQTCPISAKEGEYPTAEVDPLQVLRTNLADCAEFVKKAKDGGAEVVCFAEYYLQGILNEGRQVCPLAKPGLRRH